MSLNSIELLYTMKTFYYKYIGTQFISVEEGEKNGLTVRYLIGDNERENHDIINMSSENDIWVHIKGFPSCHVIACIPSQSDSGILDKKGYKDIVRKATRQGGILCRQYSKNTINKNGLSKSKVDMIAYQVRNLECTCIPGQVITHGDALTFSV